MAFWVLVSLVVALFALRRALTAEQALVDQRRELVELRRMVQTLADRLGERWPGATPSRRPPTARCPSRAPRWRPAPRSEARHPDARAGRDARARRAAAVCRARGIHTAEPLGPPPIRRPVPPPSPALRSSPSHGPRPAAARPITDADSLESAIGGRWLLYIGIAAIVLGASYFLKYAFDNEWIGEHTRVIFGVAGGVGLTLLGRRFVQRGHELYGQVLCGGGLGIVYLAIFAAHAWYGLIGGSFAFAAMVITTVVTAALADQQRSQALALFAVVVGFATPFLIGSERDNHIGLFTYDAMLVAGTLFLARRRAWPALNLVSYVLTVTTFAAWADRAYRPNLYVSVAVLPDALSRAVSRHPPREPPADHARREAGDDDARAGAGAVSLRLAGESASAHRAAARLSDRLHRRGHHPGRSG